MDEPARTVVALFITGMVGLGIIGVKFIIKDAMSKAYCICKHEFNEHYVTPYGFTNPKDTEKCRICGCLAFRKNEKDPRNK